MKKQILFLVGPTATGKSAVGVCLARKINAEIISCDSMQIYKGMEIITSVPKVTLRRSVRHHLLSVVSPKESYDVSRYRRRALALVRDVIKRGKIPLFVGGTGLYMSIVIDGIFAARPQNEKLRRRLYREAQISGNECLYARLKEADPAAAAKIHPNDLRRIVRALEVFLCTGKPISQLQQQRRGLTDRYDVGIFCLTMDREALKRRIDERVEKMFKQGLENEVKKLSRRELGRTASLAIGIRELKGYFDGRYGLEEVKRLIKRNTAQYAKRQLTWFRKDKRIKWVRVTESQTPAHIAEKIWKKLS